MSIELVITEKSSQAIGLHPPQFALEEVPGSPTTPVTVHPHRLPQRIELEACSLTAWLHAGLTEAGLPAICIEARQAKGAMPNKTDRNDARGIAQIMRTGWYRAVHVKSPSCQSWRALLTARRMVLNKRRDVENGIRALLREVGLKVSTPAARTSLRACAS